MKKLYLVRHGETLFNVEHRMQGWCDSPLTKKGVQQAQQAAEVFKDIKLDHAYSSTSERACDTTEIILNHRLEYTRAKGLKEFNFGVYEGQPEILEPESMSVYEKFFVEFGGDTLTGNGQRMLKTLTKIMQKPDHQNVLAVSHGWSVINFLKQSGNADDVVDTPNATIVTLSFDHDQFKLLNIDRSISQQ